MHRAPYLELLQRLVQSKAPCAVESAPTYITHSSHDDAFHVGGRPNPSPCQAHKWYCPMAGNPWICSENTQIKPLDYLYIAEHDGMMSGQAVGAALTLIDRVAVACDGGPTGFGICRPPGHHAIPTVRAPYPRVLHFGIMSCCI